MWRIQIGRMQLPKVATGASPSFPLESQPRRFVEAAHLQNRKPFRQTVYHRAGSTTEDGQFGGSGMGNKYNYPSSQAVRTVCGVK
ncbi:L-type lectin-domain containing receptor kinase IX.1-like protein [Anopheles sinensis]|uniref:L-type lectin-domain containing receptor kinase IX.1-like protein n=1 Tax=Anopheles sinensis TaxID=74873 RepID=A0A084VQU3_ANOSI|nr:L-type lectin-domain containing receptor kinase IX.1-like protein [Anopheles sinensis]